MFTVLLDIIYIFRSPTVHQIRDEHAPLNLKMLADIFRKAWHIFFAVLSIIFNICVLISLLPALKLIHIIFSVIGFVLRILTKGFTGLRRHPVILQFQPDPQENNELVGGG